MRELGAMRNLEESRQDAIHQAIERLRARMRRTSDPDPMHLEFLEDDLREGMQAVSEIEAFFEDAIALLSSPSTRSVDLVDAADDPSVLERLDYLVVVVSNVRRRLMHLATRRSS